jgi:hypothetical protein
MNWSVWLEHWPVIVLAALAAGLLLVYAAVRYWLISTRPADIQDVPTPTVDRLNTEALTQLTGGSEEGLRVQEAAEHETAPPDLLSAVVPERQDMAPKQQDVPLKHA